MEVLLLLAGLFALQSTAFGEFAALSPGKGSPEFAKYRECLRSEPSRHLDLCNICFLFSFKTFQTGT